MWYITEKADLSDGRSAAHRFALTLCVIVMACFGFSGNAAAAVEFSVSDPGEPSSLELWGIGWIGNTSSSINRMGGAQNIDVVRIGSTKEWALDENNNLHPDAIAEIDKQIAKAVLVQQGNPNVKYAMVSSGGNGINDYYVQNNGVDIRGANWLELFRATKHYVEGTYGIELAYIEVANEQDFGGKKGTKSNIHSIQQRFQADPEFADIPLVGPSTLSSGAAKNWYDVAKNSTDWGATHLIGGSGNSYINFVKQVRNDGKPYFGSEVHHLVEMIIAEEYGGIGGTWWNTVSEVRGKFVQATEGNRLFYREKAGSISAASGYRDTVDPNTIHVFASSAGGGGGATFEFQADVPVYWDGVGPQTSFTISLDDSDERYIQVTYTLPGDFDADGFVGLSDLDLILNNWNIVYPRGNPPWDANQDGFIGLADLDVVLNNWNTGLPPSALASIPEPTTLSVLSLGGIMLIRRRS